MRWSQLFIPTLKEDPAAAETASHKLLMRAGYIRPLGSGIYSLLPLAQRVRLKVINIIREEMNAIGGQEFVLPALHPTELWEESGRLGTMGDIMFRLKDRKGAELVLGVTHEEIFTSIARNALSSYRQVPQIWYQFQTKFRDELRPKSGLLRVREFTMKDSYSFDVDAAGLDQSFDLHKPRTSGYSRAPVWILLRWKQAQARWAEAHQPNLWSSPTLEKTWSFCAKAADMLRTLRRQLLRSKRSKVTMLKRRSRSFQLQG